MTQQEAINILKTGASVFLTGPAGSGKTYVLNEYVKYLRSKKIEPAITASTGIAATHLGGMTIHAWSGLGVRDHVDQSTLEELYARHYLKDRISKTDVLIIDEISMLHHFRLDLVSAILKFFKKSAEPFGGIQVILCGDFFQLPPVSRLGERPSRFAYHADSWKELNPIICYLEEQHRQTDDVYKGILDAVRDGAFDEMHYEQLMTRMIEGNGDSEITKLYSHNTDVDTENNRELTKLEGKMFSYGMLGKGNPRIIETLKKSCLAPEALKLKKGAKVMFVKNHPDQKYANGTTGIVIHCDEEGIEVETHDGEVIEVTPSSWHVEDSGKKLAEITQYPLRLAWAITIHKSQGMSLDQAEIDLSKAFERGMGYVALSRVRSLEGLHLKGIGGNALMMHEEALDMDREFRRKSDGAVGEFGDIAPDELMALQQAFLVKLGAEGKLEKKKKMSTIEITRQMFLEGSSIMSIAFERDLEMGTVITHLERVKELDPTFPFHSIKDAMPTGKFQKIYKAFQQVGTQEGGKRPLNPVKEICGSGVTFEEIRMVRLLL